MKKFLDEDFLLDTETAKKLYHEFAEIMPILDYHCHINPQEIYEDRKFDNITQVWLGGDHYKWRQMRSNGVEERYITGDATDREKFQKWAETLEMAIGNPLYHWSHLELKRFFRYEGYLNGGNAEEVWNLCNEKLQGGLSARKMIEMSNVTLICTTDDPVDSLEWHKKIAEDDSFAVQVLPAWRPDKAMNLEKADYLEYLDERFQKLPRLPEVFLCANDFIALDALQVLKKLGYGVPDDVWLCGFDDSPESKIVTPSLTTIHIHSQIMGFSAVNLLMSRISEPYLNYRTVHTETDLIYRDSTCD